MRPRSQLYLLAGAVFALALPAGLLVVRGVFAGRAPSLSWVKEDLQRFPEAYAYVTVSGMLVLGTLGCLFGRLVDRLVLLSNTDALTGLFNRRRFDEKLVNEVKRCRRFGRTACVLSVDVDRLKSINDGFGHAAGDHALVTVGRALRDGVRAVDTVARMGGDEFAMLLPETTAAQASALGRRLLATIGERAETCPGPLTVSIGVAELGAGQADRRDAVLAAADVALYRAKAAGGGCVMVSPPAAQVAGRGGRSTLGEARRLSGGHGPQRDLHS